MTIKLTAESKMDFYTVNKQFDNTFGGIYRPPLVGCGRCNFSDRGFLRSKIILLVHN